MTLYTILIQFHPGGLIVFHTHITLSFHPWILRVITCFGYNFFIYLLAICMSSFDTCLFQSQSFAHYFKLGYYFIIELLGFLIYFTRSMVSKFFPLFCKISLHSGDYFLHCAEDFQFDGFSWKNFYFYCNIITNIKKLFILF